MRPPLRLKPMLFGLAAAALLAGCAMHRPAAGSSLTAEQPPAGVPEEVWIGQKAEAFHRLTVYGAKYPSFRGCTRMPETDEYVVSFTDPGATEGIKYYFDRRGRFRDFLLIKKWY